jgi:hypothetical protein
LIEYRTRKKVDMGSRECRDILREPKRLLGHGSVITSVDSLGNGIYSVTFTWKRFGMSRTNLFEFSVDETKDSIVYRGANSSRDSFMFQFTIYSEKESVSTVSSTFRIATGYFRGDSIVKEEFTDEMDRIVKNGIQKIEDFDFTSIRK